MGCENKEKHPIYVSMLWRKTCSLIIDRKRGEKHYVLIKYFNTVMYDHSLHRRRKHFKLSFIDSFQFLSFSLDSSVKNLGKDDFKYLSKECDNNVLDLVKQKGFYHYEYMSNF